MKPISRKQTQSDRARHAWTALRVTSHLAAAIGLASCSGDVALQPTESNQQFAEQANALVAACALETVGLPCDPDGAGAATECGGVCWLNSDGQAACQPLAELDLDAEDVNGRICGDTDGLDCGKSCENGQCVDRFARLGAACRPDTNSTSCDGLCTLSGGVPSCERVDACETFGADACTLTACDFDENSQGCVEYDIGEDASCSPAVVPTPTPGPVTPTPVTPIAAGGAPATSPVGTSTPEQPAVPAKIAGGACSVSYSPGEKPGNLAYGALLLAFAVGLRRRCRLGTGSNTANKNCSVSERS